MATNSATYLRKRRLRITDLGAEDAVPPRAAACIRAFTAPIPECGRRPRRIRSPDAPRWRLRADRICNLEVPDQLELREMRLVRHEADPNVWGAISLSIPGHHRLIDNSKFVNRVTLPEKVHQFPQSHSCHPRRDRAETSPLPEYGQ